MYKNGLAFNKARFSPNGKFVCAGSSTGNLIIWDLHEPSYVTTFCTERLHNDIVSSVAWLDDVTLLSCGKDSKFVIY